MSWFVRHSQQLQQAFRWIVVGTLILTLVQPVLSGFGTFDGRSGLVNVHEMVANFLFLLALVLFALAFVSGFQHKRRMLIWSGLLLALIFVQIGLGYSGRSSGVSLALHIPNGVAVFGTAIVLSLLSFGMTLNRKLA